MCGGVEGKAKTKVKVDWWRWRRRKGKGKGNGKEAGQRKLHTDCGGKKGESKAVG